MQSTLLSVVYVIRFIASSSLTVAEAVSVGLTLYAAAAAAGVRNLPGVWWLDADQEVS